MKLVISIPVHEKPDVIQNQILNFHKYIPDSIIVLHVSKGFFDKHSLDEIGYQRNVYINPTHLDTKWSNIIQTHISNYEFIRNQLDFDYFILHASNDMYIRSGFEQYIQNYEAGFNIRKVIKQDSHWWPGNAAFQDIQLKKIMQACGQTMIIASQVESSFYRKDVMEKIYHILKLFQCDFARDLVYPREEIYFPTIASSLVSWSKIGYTTTFSEVHRFDRKLWKIRNITRYIFWNLRLSCVFPERLYWKLEQVYNDRLFETRFYKTTPHIIERILKGDKRYIEKNSYLNDGSGQFRLYDSEIFSVKRINRDISDPVRKYINELL